LLICIQKLRPQINGDHGESNVLYEKKRWVGVLRSERPERQV
jgi:hypothetical protein